MVDKRITIKTKEFLFETSSNEREDLILVVKIYVPGKDLTVYVILAYGSFKMLKK